ncbi:MAG TPA: hypothetical protein V6C65_40265 [Allocoleopsis sp.]
MSEHNAENTTQNPRGTEDSGVENSSHPYSKGRTATLSESARDLGERISRAIGAGAVERLIGGIYSRLIKEHEDRLAEARACINWYQDEERKQIEKIEELRQLVDSLIPDTPNPNEEINE